MDLAENNPISVAASSATSSTTISSHGVSGGLSFSLLSMNPTSRRSIRKRRRYFQDHAFLHLHGSSSPDQQLNHHHNSSGYTSVMARVPLPGPTWSTTAPSVVAAAVFSIGIADSPTSTSVVEEFEEILENHGADSYAWWVAFLKSLDHPMIDQDSSPLSLHHHHHHCDLHHDLVVVGDHGGLLEPSSNPQFPDEWLQLEFPLLVDY